MAAGEDVGLSGQRRVKPDGIGAHIGVGKGNGVTQRAGPSVGQIGHDQGRRGRMECGAQQLRQREEAGG